MLNKILTIGTFAILIIGAVATYAVNWADKSYYPKEAGLELAATTKPALKSFEEIQKGFQRLNRKVDDLEKDKLKEEIRRLKREKEDLKKQRGGRR